jgi:hypothetical protein
MWITSSIKRIAAQKIDLQINLQTGKITEGQQEVKLLRDNHQFI